MAQSQAAKKEAHTSRLNSLKNVLQVAAQTKLDDQIDFAAVGRAMILSAGEAETLYSEAVEALLAGELTRAPIPETYKPPKLKLAAPSTSRPIIGRRAPEEQEDEDEAAEIIELPRRKPGRPKGSKNKKPRQATPKIAAAPVVEVEVPDTIRQLALRHNVSLAADRHAARQIAALWLIDQDHLLTAANALDRWDDELFETSSEALEADLRAAIELLGAHYGITPGARSAKRAATEALRVATKPKPKKPHETRRHIFAHICEHGPLRQVDIAQQLGVHESDVSIHVRTLEAAGCIEVAYTKKGSHFSGKSDYWRHKPGTSYISPVGRRGHGETQAALLECVRKHGRVTVPECRLLVGMHRGASTHVLNAQVKKGNIRRVGKEGRAHVLAPVIRFDGFLNALSELYLTNLTDRASEHNPSLAASQLKLIYAKLAVEQPIHQWVWKAAKLNGDELAAELVEALMQALSNLDPEVAFRRLQTIAETCSEVRPEERSSAEPPAMSEEEATLLLQHRCAELAQATPQQALTYIETIIRLAPAFEAAFGG